MWDRIIDGTILESSPRRPGVANVSDPHPALLAQIGWYERLSLPADPPLGQQVSGYRWRGVEGLRSVYEPTYEAIPTPPEPIPDRFPDGIDTVLLVLDAPDGKGVGYVADADGALLPVVYAHESPYDMVALRARIAAAREAHAASRAARRAAAAAAREAAGKAGNVNALRAEVARLAAIVEALV